MLKRQIKLLALAGVFALAACGEPALVAGDPTDMAASVEDAAEVVLADASADQPDAAALPDSGGPAPSFHEWPEVLSWWQSVEPEPLCGDARLTVAALSRFCVFKEHLWSKGVRPYPVRCRTISGTIVDSTAYRTVECSS